ncbi:MAG: TetR/AcrR family transcriptional regulator, partial [Micrococcales bacterium]|nr:TetR/AcrR family transcriptional regulator [Micrococcales bacterium]
MPRPNNRERIMAAALRCFAARGFEGTKTADIAAESGMSPASLYVHFSSVNDLAQELYLTHFGAYCTEVSSICSQTSQTVVARAASVVRATLDRYRTDPDAFTFVLLRLPSFLGTSRLPQPLPIETLAGLVTEGQREGLFRDGDSTLLATMFLGAVLRVF